MSPSISSHRSPISSNRLPFIPPPQCAADPPTQISSATGRRAVARCPFVHECEPGRECRCIVLHMQPSQPLSCNLVPSSPLYRDPGASHDVDVYLGHTIWVNKAKRHTMEVAKTRRSGVEARTEVQRWSSGRASKCAEQWCTKDGEKTRLHGGDTSAMVRQPSNGRTTILLGELAITDEGSIGKLRFRR
ncbi:hypothetical protein HN51_061874 [Arachis hypogaea]